MDAIETFEHNGKTIEIHYDEPDEHHNPRGDDGNLGIMLAEGHRRYSLGDHHLKGKHSPFDDAARALEHYAGRRNIRAFVRWLRICHGARVVLPLGLIDHSGISMYVGSGAHWQDPGGWDSGLVGFIFDTPDTREEWSDLTDERIEEILRAEVEVYDQYLTGEIYGYVIQDEDGDEEDSCWGFLGSINYVRQAARDAAGYTCKHCDQEITRRLGPIVDPSPEDPNAWAHHRLCKVCDSPTAWGKEGEYHVALDVTLANHHKAEHDVRRACRAGGTVAEPAQFVGSYE